MTNSTTFPGTVTASGFTGTATNATNAVLATDDTNASRPVIFGTGTTGNVPLKTDPGIVYNPSTNKLTAGAFVGDGSELTGISAGFDPNVDKIAIGNGAGAANQSADNVAIGHDAQASGSGNSGARSIAIGKEAGSTGQKYNCVAIGFQAGMNGQLDYGVAIGEAAGKTSQQTKAIAIGEAAGYTSQGADAIAIGHVAGCNSQANNCIAMGKYAGMTSQGTYSIAIGGNTATTSQGAFSVAIGSDAGREQQGTFAVSIGHATNVGSQGNESIGIGMEAGRFSQGTRAIALGGLAQQYTSASYSVHMGYQAGRYSCGTFTVGLGYYAGNSSQPNNSFYVGTGSVRNRNGNHYLKYNSSDGEIGYHSSDDRVKDGETLITGAVKTLSKLKPQNYLKRTKLDPTAPEQNWTLESGLMAQEVYYSAPEMRHLVTVPAEAGDIDNFTPPPSDDPSQDPDYSMWGDGIATVDYMQMVPYLVKGVQEIVTELPRSKTTVSNTWGQNITGLVVSANTNKHKTNTVPIVNLSNVSMDKSWYGVVSNEKTDSIDYDTIVDIKGDSQIWVTDLGGTLESGDLLTTSNVAPGYAQKQEGGALMNYTVAKVTQDCDFTEPLQISIKIPKRELSNVTYYIHDESYEIGINDYEKRSTINTRVEETPMYFKEVTHDYIGFGMKMEKYYQGDTEIGLLKYEALPDDVIKSVKWINEVSVEEYNTLDDERKATYSLGTHKKYIHVQFSKSKKQIPQHDEVRIIEELVDVLDENGQTVWEETSNTVPSYTLVDHGTYKAAHVSCKLI